MHALFASDASDEETAPGKLDGGRIPGEER
jgi:hypothetical protein